ncbi:MAG: OmpA family protein [Planctomycetota bacterium]
MTTRSRPLMLRARRLAAVTGSAAVLGGLLGGCTTDQVLEDLRTNNAAQEQRLQVLSAENDDLRSQLNETRDRSESVETSMGDLQSENDRLLSQVRDLDGQLRRLDQMLGEIAVNTLDAETDDALRGLADRNDAIEYDSAIGVLRFSSDLTFASGSADVTAGARDALADLANVLADLDDPYELTVVGHTDSVRPSSSTARRFPTNRALSVARAISVAEVLASEGIPADAILTGGWGEHRPLVPNSETGGTPANRRVEIALAASTGSAQATYGDDASSAAGDATGADAANDTGGRSGLPPITK